MLPEQDILGNVALNGHGRIPHLLSWVRTPPIIVPKAPPTGAPAANVANATDLPREGGNECARIPSCVMPVA